MTKADRLELAGIRELLIEATKLITEILEREKKLDKPRKV